MLRLLSILVGGFVAITATVMVATLGLSIVGPFVDVLGDSGGGIGVTASEALRFRGAIVATVASVLVVPVAWFLVSSFRGKGASSRPDSRRRRPPRRRP